MASSPKEPPSVDPSSSDEPKPGPDEATRPARRRRTRAHSDPSEGRYSPVVLVMDVVRLLHGQGVAVSEAVDRRHEAVEASADLLRCVGVVPDKGVITRPLEHTAELVAAAVLMRAAGIEPNTVKTWPRRAA